ncbi:PREDICTED: uncharacterized protein LOC108767715 [Trachymyrmex cornetzi]|uniref:uncharacterized protein LOC108767715 n=2 Tax=Trachymyrmex cornetzi TaxID=471704 RepID=UPI00084F3435|nr:PREDICTED: uncharacterized protein LOC108767715 [Trachymyrmex cornetzi]
MSLKEELTKLKTSRRVAKASITRIEKFMKDMDSNTVDLDELKLKVERLEELWQSLLEIQINIAVYDSESTDEQVDLEIATLEEKYMHLKLIASRTMERRVRPASVTSNIEQASEIVNSSRVGTRENLVRLPKIDLPSFSGAYEDWHPFFDIFNSLIHSNNSLGDIQKFHYLKSALKGEAAETIASIEISGLNYADAWSRLRERYENERLAVQNHIKAIFELPILRKENCVVLRNILDGVLKHTRALQALRRPTAQWDDLLIHIITGKLDFITIKEWENSLETRELPTFQEFVEFLKRRCQTLEAVARRTQLTISNVNSRPIINAKVTTSHAAVVNAKCVHCKGDHQIYQCKSFKELSVTERLSKVKALNLCLNCLRGKHIAKDCNFSHCRKCSKKHSTLLHEDRTLSKDNKENIENVKTESETSKTINSVCAYSQFKEVSDINQILLATAIIRVQNQNGHYVGRALLDNGSQSSFITEDLFKKLNLTAKENRVEINGVNSVVSHATKTANIKITSRFGTFGTEVQCIVLPNITKRLPEAGFNVARLNIPSNIKLADPQFNIPNEIDIGADRIWELICVSQIRLGNKLPVLQKTLLGWIVAGPLGITGLEQRTQTQCNLSKIEQLNDTMHKFWEIERYKQENITCLSREEDYCEKLFRETYKRQADGRFVVKLPVKEEALAVLKDSREIALKRFLSLERKLARESELKVEYVKFMREYLKLGHMRHKISTQGSENRIFLPHHAVVKEDSVTTKTRVVFDASSKGSAGGSLNDALYKGPILQQDLFALIIRFRCFKYVLCADISKMYRQILIHEEQTPLQSILWREDSESEIEEFELLTVTYGTKPASFLAVRCLHQLAELEKKNFLKAAEVITRDFYMDDLLRGGNTVQEIRDLKVELIEVLAKGGFELHKWNTNVKNMENDRQSNKAVDISKVEGSKLLGILWEPHKDTFHYQVETRDCDARVTKRAILSQIWLDWDESVPMDIHEAWSKMRAQLHLLNTLRIPRLILSVLAWIKSDSRKWQTFVANRVSEIHDNSSLSEWHYVKSQENPADLVSRGRTSEQLIQEKLWWKGPDWLKINSKAWPEESEELSSKDVPEGRKQAVIAIAVKKETIIDCQRYSTLNKLLHVVQLMY